MRGCVHCGRDKEQHAPETLVCPDGKHVYGSMDLPAGATCGNCLHFKRTCEWLISATDNRTSCDWYPVRFARGPARADTL
jgi:hypothetical protein